jgi:hypothetical protein
MGPPISLETEKQIPPGSLRSPVGIDKGWVVGGTGEQSQK